MLIKVKQEDGSIVEMELSAYILDAVEKGVEAKLPDLQEQLTTHLEPLFKDTTEELRTKINEVVERVSENAKQVKSGDSVYRPSMLYKDNGIVELEDGSLIDIRRRTWKYVGPTASEYAKALGEVLFAKAHGRTASDKALQVLNDTAEKYKYLNEDRGPQGGFLVPPEYSTSIIEVNTQWASLWPLATSIPIEGTEISFPKLKQTLKGADQSSPDYFAGVVGQWTESGEEKPETQPQFESITLHPYEYAMITYVQNSLLQSSPILLLNYINILFSNAYTWYVDKAFIDGSGAGQPLGILNDPQIRSVARQTANRVKYNDLLNMQDALPDPFQMNAIWMGSRNVLNNLRKQVDSNNMPIVQMVGRQELERGYYTDLLGIPFVPTTHKTSALGTAGDLILCDPSQYYIGDRMAFTIDTSTHFKFSQNRTAIRGSGMVDGKPAISKAFVQLDSVVDS